MATYQLTIVTPEKMVFDQKVISLTAPGSIGYLGILANHAPIMTGLVPGKLSIRTQEDKSLVFAIDGGFLECSFNKVTILADAIIARDDIQVEQEKKQAEKIREELKNNKLDVDLLKLELSKILNRIKLSSDRE
jgi:F-type H+-transporting ATPase subunit epsilon